MFLNHRFSPAATLLSSPPVNNHRSGVIESANTGNRKQQPRSSSTNDNERRVLGFDVFSLEATRRSNVDLETWKNGETRGGDNDANFFPAPGLSWNSNAPTIRLLPNKIPAWFPWIPTKSQIQSLKVVELKAACDQRGLVKVRIHIKLLAFLADLPYSP
jgi:hypothetical protein